MSESHDERTAEMVAIIDDMQAQIRNMVAQIERFQELMRNTMDARGGTR